MMKIEGSGSGSISQINGSRIRIRIHTKISWIRNTVSKYNLVKVPEVEVWPEGLLRPGPQLSDLELANLVAGGLTRPGDVASHL